MTDLTTNMLAPEFVNKLNANLHEAASSGSGSGGSRTLKLQMQGGAITTSSPASGTTTVEKYNYVGGTGVTSNDEVFFKSCHTVLMLCIENCSITNISVATGETLTVFFYDSNMAYISHGNSYASIPSGACYAKFMLTKSTAYDSIPQLEITVTGKPTLHKNVTPTLVSERHFSFDTTYPAIFDNIEEINTYIGENAASRYYDNGWIKLPPNYSADGAPVPLVVNIHGTNGYDFYKGPKPLGYDVLQSFIANNGYAVCDCSGVTNKDKMVVSEYDDAFYAPSLVSSINNMVRFLIANYNIKEDGVYLLSKSAGGYILHLITQTQGLKIRAAASLAPGISPLSTMRYYISSELEQTKRIFSQLGIDYTLTNNWSNDKPYVLANIHKLRQMDCLFMGADLTDDQVRTLAETVYNDASANANSSGTKKDFTKSTTCMNTLGSARIHVPVPTKIWAAPDDTAISYNMAKLFAEMAQRSGSPVYIRTMEQGTGGHHSVDTDGNAPKVAYKTKYAGTATVAVAYAEAVDWFNRW